MKTVELVVRHSCMSHMDIHREIDVSWQGFSLRDSRDNQVESWQPREWLLESEPSRKEIDPPMVGDAARRSS